MVATVVLILAAVLAYYSLKKPPEEAPRLELILPKTSYLPGESITVEVWLDNRGGGERRYVLPSPQLFRLEVHNESGGLVAAYDTGEEPSPTELKVGAGERVRLGVFEWNQTIRVEADGNSTWEQVPAGTYALTAWLSGHFDIQAKREVKIA